jgi:hypothetical protein
MQIKDSDLAVILSLSLENGFHYVPLLSADFSSHRIDMGNTINMIVVTDGKFKRSFCCKSG